LLIVGSAYFRLIYAKCVQAAISTVRPTFHKFALLDFGKAHILRNSLIGFSFTTTSDGSPAVSLSFLDPRKKRIEITGSHRHLSSCVLGKIMPARSYVLCHNASFQTGPRKTDKKFELGLLFLLGLEFTVPLKHRLAPMGGVLLSEFDCSDNNRYSN